jgi:RNA polymerase sigma-70 factor (ECF subfamily)
MSGVNDIELLRRYREEGCEQSLSAVVERHRSMIYRTCLRVLGEHTEALDAVQDVMLLLLRKVDELLGRESLEAWFYWVALNVSRVQRRAAMRRDRAEKQAQLLRRASGSAPRAPGDEFGADLEAALASLPERNRAALIMAYGQGMPRKEVAFRLGIAPGTVRNRLAIDLRRLRERLAGGGPISKAQFRVKGGRAGSAGQGSPGSDAAG